MEPIIDPASGQPLPADAIQRVLFVASAVHVYNIPPLTSTKGHTAAHWTGDDNQRLIFTARIRILETAWEDQSGKEKIKVDIVLEDRSTGQLFAAAPYQSPAVVEPVLDSSRFFALRVQDPTGRKATLGIGFEERSESFDFGVAIQEGSKSLGLDDHAGLRPSAASTTQTKEEPKRDYSLKEGETITVNLGGKFGRRRPQQDNAAPAQPQDLSSFSLPPPPSAPNSGSGPSPLLPPPPGGAATTARTQRDQKRRSIQELGFDDGQFGEFA